MIALACERLLETAEGYLERYRHHDGMVPSLYFKLWELWPVRASVNIRTVKGGYAAARRRGKHMDRPIKLSREQVDYATQIVREERETLWGVAGLLNVGRATLHQALKRNF